MKKMLLFSGLLLGALSTSFGIGIPLDYVISEKGPHYRKWERVALETNQAGVQITTNSYFEIAAGMHRLDDSEFVETDPVIELQENGATAQQTRHQVNFAATVGDTNGTIDLLSADAKQLVSQPLGIAYYDSLSEQSVLIAELIPDIPGVLYPPDMIVYTNCFTDFAADLEYKNMRCGLEQNLVFQERPPAPSFYDLDNETTYLQLFTEFVDPPEPIKRSITKDGMQDDAILDFGEMKIIRGKSFMAGAVSNAVAVSKQWTNIEGRTFLIEQVAYRDIESFLNTLPQPQQASILKKDKIRYIASTERFLPERKFVASTSAKTDVVHIASVPRENKGFVLDYILVGSSSDVTFKADTTYYVSDTAYLSGTNIFEGGTVIKFHPDNYSQLLILDEMVCWTSPYRPAFFTSRDDDTVGEIISESTGNPATNYYYPGLNFANYDHAETDVKYCHFRYAETALCYDNWPAANKVRHCQFVNCTQGAIFVGLENNIFKNVLMDHVGTTFLGWGGISAQHMTINASDYIADGEGITVQFTNCLLVSVTNSGTPYVNETNENFFWFTDDPGVFQTVGAGSHYLATNSPFRDVGTSDIDEDLLAELKKKTTYPPEVLASAITVDTALAPMAERDTNTLDIGYHYDALDYAINTNVTDATLTLTNGVALAVFGTNALALESGSKLVSVGAPANLNRIVRYQCVQEQAIFWDGINIATIKATGSTNDVYPSVNCRFTEMAMPSMEAGRNWLFLTEGLGPTNVIFRDSLIWNGAVELSQGVDRCCFMTFTNTAFHRVNGRFDNLTNMANAYDLHLWNNLFLGGTLGISNEAANVNWSIHNNSFDNVSLTDYQATPNSHNAYINISALSGSSGNDVTLETFVYAYGPLGCFYHGQEDLVDAGYGNADAEGGYHFTTTTDQTKEADSAMDIGFHYIAVDEGGNPIDTDIDELPDYYEDTNGNGTTEEDETDWE